MIRTKYITINLNESVKVLLSDLGLKELKTARPSTFDSYQQDANGYTEIMWWEFVEIFGKVINKGNAYRYFSMNVKYPISINLTIDSE